MSKPCPYCGTLRGFLARGPSVGTFDIPERPVVTTTLRSHIDSLIAKHGGLRAAARVLKMTPQYLYRLQAGEKDNPSEKMLRKLGLRRAVTVTYSAARGTAQE